MQKPQENQYCSLTHLPDPPSLTLSGLIDSIEFSRKSKCRSSRTCSETESISSCQSIEGKEKSKVWSGEEVQLFGILLRKYGTDFHILSAFFPRKTKSQLKNRYKVYMSLQRKREKAEVNNLKALSALFRQVDEIQQKDEREDDCIIPQWM